MKRFIRLIGLVCAFTLLFGSISACKPDGKPTPTKPATEPAGTDKPAETDGHSQSPKVSPTPTRPPTAVPTKRPTPTPVAGTPVPITAGSKTVTNRFRKDSAPVMVALYVSQNGSDTNYGTPEKPLRTLAKAQEYVKKYSRNMNGDIYVCIMDMLKLDQTLEIDKTTFATNGYRIIYQGPKDMTGGITGGRKVTNWQTATDIGPNVVKASVPGLAGTRQFYVNGQRRQRAKNTAGEEWSKAITYYHPYNTIFRDGPNISPSEKDPNLPEEVAFGVVVPKGSIPTKFKNINDLEYIGSVDWVYKYLHVKAIYDSGDKSIITFRDNEGELFMRTDFPPKRMGQVFLLENAIELLDEPGEWYFDKSAKTMYYCLKPGETAANISAYVPEGPETFIKIYNARNITLRNLQFTYSTWLHAEKYCINDVQAMNFNYIGDNGGTFAATPPGLITADYMNDSVIEGCVFKNLGTTAIVALKENNGNIIRGNLFYNLASGAIHLGSTGGLVTRGGCYDNQFTDNHVEGIGRDYGGAVAVFFGYTHGSIIKNNEICYTNYTAISEGWGWTDKPTILGEAYIAYNNIHHIMEDLSDGGGIYTLSRQPGTVIEYNWLHDQIISPYAYPWIKSHGHFAIYLDEGTQYTTVRFNLIEGFDIQVLDKDSSDYPGKGGIGGGPPALDSNVTVDGTKGTAALKTTTGPRAEYRWILSYK